MISAKQTYESIAIRIAASICLFTVARLDSSYAQAEHGTTIILCGNADTLYVGADSRMMKDENEIVSELTCKIRRINDSTFASLSGICQEPLLGINVLREAAKYGRLLPTGSMIERGEDIADFLQRKIWPGLLAKYETPHLDTVIAELILFGRENDTLRMVALDFGWESTTSQNIIIQPAKQICFAGIWFLRYISGDPEIRKIAKRDSIRALPMLEQVRVITAAAVTYTKTSGPPIDILCVTRHSYQWLQRKPECED